MTKLKIGFGLLAVAGAVQAGELRLSLEDYRDKVRGAWIGQMVGVEWGAPTENVWRGTVMPAEKVPEWRPEKIGGSFNNDDLYVEMTFLKSLEDYGLDVSQRQAGIDFANSEYRLWCANEAGRNNLRIGIAPPDSGHPRFNKRPNDIDYQIEADYSGIVAPGLPQEAVRLGRLFGGLMNYGDGVWAGQFVGALYAKAFFTSDVNELLDAGLAAIPAESDYAQMVRNLRAWHRESPDCWSNAWAKATATYFKDRNPGMRDSNGIIDVRLNGAMVVLGLLYGEGDLDRSIVISMRGGYDSDCNPSSVGGILMCSRGAKALDAKYVSKLNPKSKFSFSPYDFETLCAVCEKLARQVVARYGGRVEKDAQGKEWFVIPEKAPVPEAWVPSWNAPAPAGSLYTREEMKAQRHGVFFESIGKLDDPDPTVRVQAALDALHEGWTTSKNGTPWKPRFIISIPDRRGSPAENCILTHPPSNKEPVVLSRKLTVPGGNPALHLEVASVPRGDFLLEVEVDGLCLLKTQVGVPRDYKGWGHDFKPFDISLAPWIGKTVEIRVKHHHLGNTADAAIWRDIRVTSDVGGAP